MTITKQIIKQREKEKEREKEPVKREPRSQNSVTIQKQGFVQYP